MNSAHSAGVKGGKTFNRCQACEDSQLVLSTGKHSTGAKRGKHSTGAKRGKTFNRCEARENMHQETRTRKRATRFKRGKTCNKGQAREIIQPGSCVEKRATSQARENMQLMPSTGKYASVVRPWNTYNRWHERLVL